MKWVIRMEKTRLNPDNNIKKHDIYDQGSPYSVIFSDAVIFSLHGKQHRKAGRLFLQKCSAQRLLYLTPRSEFDEVGE